MYIYFVYPAISKSPKQLTNCLKNKRLSKVPSVTSALILLPFLSIAQQESSNRKAIFWSMTVTNIYPVNAI